MAKIGTKEEAEQSLSDKIAELTINVEGRECNNEPADDPVLADGETSRTPTAKKHRIPELLSCPPAPRKRLEGSFFADEDEPKKAVDGKEIKTLFSPDQDSSNKSSRQ